MALQESGERLVGEQRNHGLDEVTIGGGFDGHGQLHGRSFHLHCRLRVFVHGAVDDVGPLDQFRNRARIEAEVFFRDHRNEAGAGFEIRIVEFAVALILLEVGGIGRRKKSAFVVIEPPGDFGRTGILEIDDGILVAVKLLLVEKRTRTMQQAGVDEVHIAADSFPVEAGEQGCRGSPVKTLVVIKDPYSQIWLPYPFLRACGEKQLELLVWRLMSRRMYRQWFIRITESAAVKQLLILRHYSHGCNFQNKNSKFTS